MVDHALPYENADTKVRPITPSVLHDGIMPITGQLVLRHRRSFLDRRFFEGFIDKFGADKKTWGSVLRVSRYSMMALLRPATLLNVIRDGSDFSAENRA
jgi:hypothetical protein